LSDSVIDHGVVTKVSEDSVHVKFEQKDQCSSCGARLLCLPHKSKFPTLVAKNTDSVEVGDNVIVKSRGNALFRLSIYQYGLPLTGFIVGIFLSNLIFANVTNDYKEVILFAGGLIGLVIAGIAARLLLKRIAINISSQIFVEKK
jgi:positive regulator of sigma E activity